MNYHLLNCVNKYLPQTSINIACSLNKYNNRIKYTYLYRIRVIRINYRLITKNIPKKYKYIVTGIKSGEEIRKVMKYGLYIIGIILKKFSGNVDNLPQTLKLLKIYGYNFNQSVDKLPQSLKSLSIYSDNFDQPVDNLPQTIISLSIDGDYFDQSLDKLPHFLKLLKIYGYDFNRSVDNLPRCLK